LPRSLALFLLLPRKHDEGGGSFSPPRGENRGDGVNSFFLPFGTRGYLPSPCRENDKMGKIRVEKPEKARAG